jgi:hypothetical protein
MAGLTITVGGNDITQYVDVRSIWWEETGIDRVAICGFTVRDHSGTVSIATKDTIDIDDDGTTVFAGEVATVDDEAVGVAIVWTVRGQDYNILLDETVVESEDLSAGTSDSSFINTLFTSYRSDINATTHVATLDASMEAVSYAAMTLREILDDLASRTGALYYVDFDKDLHWFSTEANAAAFGLSTSPDGSTTYGFGGFRRSADATRLADKVYVKGKEVDGWYPAGAPSYDGSTRHAVSRDQRITTSQGVTDRGTAIHDEFSSARTTYDLWTEVDGLRAGMSFELTHETLGISAETYYIRKIRMEMIGDDGDQRRYHLTVGDVPPDMAAAQRSISQQIGIIETQINEISDDVFDTDSPSAPTALGAGNVTTGVTEDADGHQNVFAEITWASVSDSDLHHYEVQLSTASDFSSDLQSRIHPSDGDRVERFSGLIGNITYYVRVRAVDWVGNTSDWDYGGGSPHSFTSSSDSSAPAQVANLAGSSSRTLVGLSWDANTEADLAYYEIQRADDSGGAAGAYSTIAQAKLNFYIDQDFTDGEISAQDTFWYRVRAVDTSGNQGNWATEVDVTLGQITTDHIAADTIVANNIAANTITASEIAANTITASEIAASTITATELNVSQLSAIAANMGTLTAGEIRVGSGTVGTDFTGFRIYSTYIGGFNDDTFQAGIRASDGKIVAGGGEVELDADGISIGGGDGTANLIKWYDATDGGFYPVQMYGNYSSAAKRGIGSISVHPASLATDDYISYFTIRCLRGGNGGLGERGCEVQVDAQYRRFEVKGAVPQAKYVYIYPDSGLVEIEQYDEDGNAIELASSGDVAHGATDEVDTGIFGRVKKTQGNSGGLTIDGFKDSDGANAAAMQLRGYLAENMDTTKTVDGRAVCEVGGFETSGASVTNTVANGNVFAVRTQRSGGGESVVIIDEDGDIYYDGSTTSYDDFNDPVLAQDLAHIMSGEYEKLIEYNRSIFEQLGIIGPQNDRGRFMVSSKRLNALLLGAIGQLYTRLQHVEQKALSA